jgi:phosphatidylserine/phosphatidylglycerophosphate/cardiolipin synthase-like enzyme
MNESESVGGALFRADDPVSAGNSLVELLVAEQIDTGQVRARGFEPALVEALRRKLPRDRDAVEIACAAGAAWVLGFRAAKEGRDTWEVVASLPSSGPLPRGLRRTTGETIIGLATSARERIHLSAPYLDTQGIGFLFDAISAATVRGVSIRLFDPVGWEPAKAAIAALRDVVSRTGNPSNLRLVQSSADSPFAHLKVMVVDGIVAYVGSANVTGAGLAGRNLELGVLVKGKHVAVIETILDLYQAYGDD